MCIYNEWIILLQTILIEKKNIKKKEQKNPHKVAVKRFWKMRNSRKENFYELFNFLGMSMSHKKCKNLEKFI